MTREQVDREVFLPTLIGSIMLRRDDCRERTLCRSSDDEDSTSEVICAAVAERSDIESSRSEERHSVRSLQDAPHRIPPPLPQSLTFIVTYLRLKHAVAAPRALNGVGVCKDARAQAR